MSCSLAPRAGGPAGRRRTRGRAAPTPPATRAPRRLSIPGHELVDLVCRRVGAEESPSPRASAACQGNYERACDATPRLRRIRCVIHVAEVRHETAVSTRRRRSHRRRACRRGRSARARRRPGSCRYRGFDHRQRRRLSRRGSERGEDVVRRRDARRVGEGRRDRERRRDAANPERAAPGGRARARDPNGSACTHTPTTPEP
jgi:hypothetical protein